MIISRTPVRISLGGGGTDLPSYYRQFGGFLVAAAIDKYVHICCTRRFLEEIRLSYSKTEIVDDAASIEHPIFKEALAMTGVSRHVELVSIADVPASCGLGTSSAFTVSLLHALHAYKRESISAYDLASEACDLEMERLGQPIGKQDQFIASFGGITAFTFKKDDTVVVERLEMSEGDIEELNTNVLMFYTGVQRNASDILKKQDASTKQGAPGIVDRLHRIKEIGLESRKVLESGDLDRFGELLHEHWTTKKGLGSGISLGPVDEAYEEARRLGALGGKLIGAGGGGFLMMYCPGKRREVINALKSKGLAYTRYRFDFVGSTIVANYRSVH